MPRRVGTAVEQELASSGFTQFQGGAVSERMINGMPAFEIEGTARMEGMLMDRGPPPPRTRLEQNRTE